MGVGLRIDESQTPNVNPLHLQSDMATVGGAVSSFGPHRAADAKGFFMSTELLNDFVHVDSLIENGLNTFIEVGNALIKMRDEKLYSEKYATFEDYCSQRHGISRPRAYQLIEAAKTVKSLSTIVDIKLLPVTESQVRALQNATSNPKEQVKILKKAEKDAPKDKSGKPKITASAIKQASVSTIVDAKLAAPKVDHVEAAMRLSEFRQAPPPAAKPDSIDEALNRLMQASSAVIESASAVRLAMESRAKLRDGFENRIAGYRKNQLDGLDVQASALFECSSALRAAWKSTSAALTLSDRPKPVESLKRV